MLLDVSLNFSLAQAITSTAASTGVLDMATGQMLTGTTFSLTPPINVGPNLTSVNYFGEDLGIGQSVGTPRIVGSAIAAFTAAGSATLQVSLQGAPMNATAAASGNISDLVFTDFIETGAIPKASLTAGQRIFSFDLPKRQTGIGLPRFLRLNYVVATGPMTAGTVTADVTLGPDDATGTISQYPSGYHVAA